jgi:hypothetical protein
VRRALLFAAGAGILALGCSHAQPSPESESPAPRQVRPSGVRYAVLPIEISAELKNSSLPDMFEQLFCSTVFSINDRQVVCSDQVRLFLQHQRESAIASGAVPDVEASLANFDAPRRVLLTASAAGEEVVIAATVVDSSGDALGRFHVSLRKDGADVAPRAEELAAQVVGIPK